MSSFPAFLAPTRVLMGPGPSQVPASVLSALGSPTIGHLDPAFLGLLDQTSIMLRALLGTSNELTMPMSGTGSLGMETCIVNLVQPGSRVLVGINGVFGQRLAEVASRAGATVTVAESPWGRALDIDLVRKAAAGGSFDVLCVVHAETSTGALTPLGPFRELADQLGALLLVDAVTSLGGVAIDMDEVGIDALYSGTQKCLSCPPGLAPISLSARAREQLTSRSARVQSWYADLGLISRYWGGERLYHHTAPINMLYGLHEALRLVHLEGLETRILRHKRLSAALWAGLEAMGLRLPVPAADRLPPLTLVEVPEGIDEALVRRTLLARYQLEIGAGLGVFKGKAFRIGLMGESCTERNVLVCLSALEQALAEQGFRSRQPPLPAAIAQL